MRVTFQQEMSGGTDIELGPFESLTIEDHVLIADGDQVAEVFVETTDDMIAHVLGHPAAGKWCVPACEPGARGYERMVISDR